MKSTKTRRFLSLLLVLAMAFSMVITCAAADDSETPENIGEDASGEVLEEPAGEDEQETPAGEDEQEVPEQVEVSDEEETEPADQDDSDAPDVPAADAEDESVEEVVETYSENGIQTLDTDYDTVHVSSLEDLEKVFGTAEIYDADITIILDANIQLDSTITNVFTNYNSVVFDGQDQFSLIGNGTALLFSLTTGSADGKSISFQNITLDGNGYRIFYKTTSSGHKVSVSFTDVLLRNGVGTSYSAPVISLVYGSDFTFTRVKTEGCKGNLLYTTYDANVTIDECILTSDCTSGSSGYGIITCGGASATWPSTWNIKNSTITASADSGTPVQGGIRVLGSNTVTLDDGTTVIVPDNSVKAVDCEVASCDIVLNECTLQCADGSNPIVYVSNASSTLETDGNLTGTPVVSMKPGMNFQLNNTLQNKVLFDYTDSIDGTDPQVAVGTDTHKLDDTDVGMLEFNGETDRTLILDETANAIYFTRAEETTVEVNDAASFKEAVENTDYTSKTIKLAGDIKMDSDTVVTSFGAETIVIDGQGEYTLSMTDDGSGSLRMFSSTAISGKDITFKDITIDAGNERLLYVSGANSNVSFTFDHATINNVYGSGTAGSSGIFLYGSGGEENLVFQNQTTVDGTGVLVSGQRSHIIVDNSTLTSTAVNASNNMVIEMEAGASASSHTRLNVQNESVLTMKDTEDLAGYAVYHANYSDVVIDTDSVVQCTNASGNTYALYCGNTTSLTDTLGSCTFQNTDGTQSMIYLRSTSNYVTINGDVKGNPIIYASPTETLSSAPILLATELKNTITFAYTSSIAGMDPVVAGVTSGYSLSSSDPEYLVYADTESPRRLASNGSYIILVRSDETKTMEAGDAETLKEILANESYSDYTELYIQLTDDIKIDTDTMITTIVSDNVVIDGKGESKTYKIEADGLAYNQAMFGSLTSTGKELTFQNLTLDANGARSIVVSTTNLNTPGCVYLTNVTLTDQECTYYNGNNCAIYPAAANIVLDNVKTENCIGTILYSTTGSVTIMNSVLSTQKSDSVTQACAALYINSGNSNGRVLTISNTQLSWTDNTGLMRGIYLGSTGSATRTVTIDQGSVLTSNSPGADAIYVNSAASDVTLNDCTLTGDGSSTIVELNNSSCVLVTSGQVKGEPTVLLTNGAKIQLNSELQYTLKYDFKTNPGTSTVVVACPGPDRSLSDVDLSLLKYADEGSPRTLSVNDADGYAYLSPTDISECSVTLAGIAVDENGVPILTPDKHFIIYETWTAGEVKPDVIIENAYGIIASSDNYTVVYDGDTEIPVDSPVGYSQTATATVTPQNGLTGDSVELIYDIVVPETEDLSDTEKTSIVLNYDDGTGTYTVEVHYEQAVLTEGEDYTVAYDLDADRYEMTVTISGIGYYVGSLSKTVQLPGWDKVLAYVDDETSLNAALDAGLERIYFTADISVSDVSEISDSVTIDGQGHTLTVSGFTTPGGSSSESYKTVALLSVQEGLDVTITGLTVDGSNVAHCLYAASGSTVEVTGGSVLKNGGQTSNGYDGGALIYVDENAEVTLTSCDVRDNNTNNTTSNAINSNVGIIRNLGVLNVGQDTYLTNLQTDRQAIMNEGTLNWNGGTYYIDGVSGSYSEYSTASAVGAVICNTGTFNMIDGEINGFLLDSNEEPTTSEYTTSFHGAIDNYGVLNISGGIITGVRAVGSSSSGNDNTAGGGAVNNSGTFTMTGGTITQNASATNGGGVYNSGTFQMYSGTISENSAALGGGLYNAGEFVMTDGLFSDNTLTGSSIESRQSDPGGPDGTSTTSVSNIGSAICLVSGSTSSISGGTVEGNVTSKVTLDTDTTVDVGVGIALYAGSSTSNGMNAQQHTVLAPTDVALTVSGDPEINVDILLMNTIGTYEYSAWLTLDGTLQSPVQATVLNNETSGFTGVKNGDIIATYEDGADSSDDDRDLIELNGDPYLYLTHLEFSRTRSDTRGGPEFDPTPTTTYYDFDAWVVCTHEDMQHYDAVEATCIQIGNIEYYQCDTCFGYFEDAEGENPLTVEEVFTGLGDHDWVIVDRVEPTATTAGSTTGVQCSVCGTWLIPVEPIDPEPGDVDKDALESVVDSVEALDKSDYTDESWADLQAALAAAQSVLNDENATEAEVEYALADLSIAIANLQTTSSKQSTAFTGFKNENGVWQYYVNDVKSNLNSVVSGTVNGTDGMWYILNGVAQLDFTGLCNYADANDNWWYVTKGKVDTSHNGVDQNNYGWWYVTSGKVPFSYTGVTDYSNAYGYWYVKNGKVDFSKTGIEPNSYGWWRVVSGKVDFSCNSVEQNDYGWWYLVGGKVQFGYTGVANYSNAYGWWYVKEGKVDFSKTSIEQNNYGWWRVVNGKVDFSCNSVEQNDYGWWYVVGGKVQFGYTGVANYANAYGWWYIKEGKVDFSYTGRASNNYGTWYVVNGKVDFSRS